MTPKRVLLSMCILLIMSIMGSYFWLALTAEKVTEENYRKLRSGMSPQEVENIVGGPAEEGWGEMGRQDDRPGVKAFARSYVGEEGKILVFYDNDDKVISFGSQGFRQRHPKFLRTLRGWLGL